MAPVVRNSRKRKLKVMTKDVMQAKMFADYMFDEILSNLNDVERTGHGIKFILHVTVRHPIIKSFITGFFKKLEDDPSYASRCSAFQKRILLFSVIEYVIAGEDLALRFTSKQTSPLEAVLHRLADLAVAFESVFNVNKSEEEFVTKILLQTVKQAILLFLKNDQAAKASEILHLHRVIIPAKKQEAFKKLITQCSDSKTALDMLLAKPGHSYAAYYAVMSDFISALNASLEETKLSMFAQKVESESDVVSDFQEEESVASERGQLTNDGSVDGSRASDLESAAVVDDDTALDKEDNILDPKSSLSYRLKKQSHTSGILIPCKCIVDHCRKVDNAVVAEDQETSFQFPQTSTSKLKAKPSLQRRKTTRNYLLGERFDNVNGTVRSLRGRSYKANQRTVYTLEQDSYIVTGCRHIGIGRWKEILEVFPFPSCRTATKIKDRFRTLINLNHIAILDDGDFTVLNTELKSKLPEAEEILKVHSKKMERKTKQQHDLISISKHDRKNNKSARRSLHDTFFSASSDEETCTLSTRRRQKTFLPVEDAYLLCGVRNFGVNWAAVKQYMDFRPDVTLDDMQKRWDFLIENGDIEAKGDYYICHNDDLLQKCKKVTDTLKEKIRSQRRRFEDGKHESDSSGHSKDKNSVASSEEHLVRSSKKHKQRLSSDSCEEGATDGLEHNGTAELRPATSAHNTSVDAETQTPKRKFTLQDQSPGVLDADSSSEDSKSEAKFTTGSTIRPSVLNLFKRKGESRKRRSLRIRGTRDAVNGQRGNEAMLSRRKAWSDAEVKKLFELLPKYGPGRWAQILDAGYDVFRGRSSLMIKDKYRNLLKSGIITESDVANWKMAHANE